MFDQSIVDTMKSRFDAAGEEFLPMIRRLDGLTEGMGTIVGWDIVLDVLQAIDATTDLRNVSRPVPPDAVELHGKTYWRNAEQALVPVEAVRPADQLEDEVVRKIIGYADPLSEQISRFWKHTREDVAAFVDLVLQQYATTRGGKKGNITLTSFNGMLKVELRVARLIEFGADLQAAKQLTDECLAGWPR